MKIDYKKYHVYGWTRKHLEKRYSKEILEKHGVVLAYLCQNGYDVKCETMEEIEEQLSMWNWFQTTEDVEEMGKLASGSSDFTLGKKIVSEELYDIIKETSFIRKDCLDNPVVIKQYASSNWNNIGKMIGRLSEVFGSGDSEIAGAVSTIENSQDILDRIDFLEKKYDSGLKVLTWLKAYELSNLIYSAYIRMSKTKTDFINVSKASNINDEIYGGIGGYNPITGEIKSIIGSAVWELKSARNGSTKAKLRTIASKILEDGATEKPTDDDGIKYLVRWYLGKETDDEQARRVIVSSLCFGILSLLCLKHNLSLIADPKNNKRADSIYSEMKKILEYCGIEASYLL